MTGEDNTSGFDVSVDVLVSLDVVESVVESVPVSLDVSVDVLISLDVVESVVESVPVSLEVSVVVGPQETKTSKAPKITERKRLLIIVNPF
jgi:hypothetical protein